MTQQPFVSVILPTYNAQNYLKESIESIRNQTYRNLELLMIDDGSTDHTREIIEEFARMDYRIKLIDGPRQGIAAALNYGIERAKGEYIARMDADDISLPNRLQIQIGIMEDNKEIGVCSSLCKLYYCNGDLKENPICPQDHDAIKCSLLFCNPITHSSVVMRKSVLGDDIRYDETVVAEDYELWTRLVCLTKFYCVQEPQVYFRWDNKEKLTTVREEAVRRSAVMISRNYIKNLFDISLEDYEIEDFYPIWSDFQYPSGVAAYIHNEYRLLRDIYAHNERNGVVDRKILEDHLNDRWRSALMRHGFLIRWNHLDEVKITNTDDSAKLKENIALLNHFRNDKVRIVIYGMGIRGRQLLDQYEKVRKNFPNIVLAGLADKNAGEVCMDGACMAGTGCDIWYPDEIPLEEIDYLCISSNKYYDEIFQELVVLGADRRKILRGSIFDALLQSYRG